MTIIKGDCERTAQRANNRASEMKDDNDVRETNATTSILLESVHPCPSLGRGIDAYLNLATSLRLARGEDSP